MSNSKKPIKSVDTLMTGWLSPSDGLYPCHTYDHISEARDLVEEYHYTPIRIDGRLLSADDILLKNGWVHIGFSCGILGKIPVWRIGWDMYHHLTSEQINFLKPYFEEDNVDEFDRSRWNDR